jgi:GNAT superfamily N-acetyltransferase
MGLLADAYERCRGPEDAGEPPLDRAGVRALVRDLDLWCSSSMVALESGAPVGVLLGAKRPAATLVHALRVHPDHRRRGHGRHLLSSLGQKLAILGPPRLVAEVPAERAPALALFVSCRWREEGRLVDWTRPRRSASPRPAGSTDRHVAVAPVGVDEAAASGLLPARPRAWHRDSAALGRLAERLVGLGFFSAERLEACLVHRADDAAELVALGAEPGELGGAAAGLLLDELERRTDRPLRLARVAPGELPETLLGELGFVAGGEHRIFATEARAA